MNLTRRHLARTSLFGAALLGLASTPLATPALAARAKFRLRYGTAFPSNHPGATRIAEAAEAIRKQTNGEVDLQVYPDSQLGSEPDMFSQVRSGALDFMSTSGVNQTVVPVGGINAIAFAFKTYADVWAAMDGDLGGFVRDAFSKVGLYVLPKMLDNGYRDITSSEKPIVKPEDLKNFKIRVPGNPLWVTLFKDLGAAPTPINFGELYASLQTRVVDGQENPLAMIQSAKLYEVQKYVTLSNHIWDGHYIFSNAARWKGLPAEVQKTLAEGLDTAALNERADIKAFNETALGEMKKAGLVANELDTAPFRATLRDAGFYTDWKEKFGAEAWSHLEKYVGTL